MPETHSLNPTQSRRSVEGLRPTSPFPDSPETMPGTPGYEVRRDSSLREWQKVFSRVWSEKNFQKLLTKKDLSVLHVGAGNGATTESLLTVLGQKGILSPKLVNMDFDPQAERGHKLAGLPGEFLLQDVTEHLSRKETGRYDLIVGLLVFGNVVISVAEHYSQHATELLKQDSMPYGLLTTSSPSSVWETNPDFADYLQVQEWINEHEGSPVWISSESSFPPRLIDMTYVVGVDPQTRLRRDPAIEINRYRTIMND